MKIISCSIVIIIFEWRYKQFIKCRLNQIIYIIIFCLCCYSRSIFAPRNCSLLNSGENFPGGKIISSAGTSFTILPSFDFNVFSCSWFYRISLHFYLLISNVKLTLSSILNSLPFWSVNVIIISLNSV